MMFQCDEETKKKKAATQKVKYTTHRNRTSLWIKFKEKKKEKQHTQTWTRAHTCTRLYNQSTFSSCREVRAIFLLHILLRTIAIERSCSRSIQFFVWNFRSSTCVQLIKYKKIWIAIFHRTCDWLLFQFNVQQKKSYSFFLFKTINERKLAAI